MNSAFVANLSALAAAGEAPARELAKSVGLGSIALAVMGLIFLWIVTRLGVIAMALYFQATCPRASGNMARLYDARGVRCFFVGLLNAVLGTVLGLLLISTEVLALLGLVVLAALIALVAIGFGISYASLGERLSGASGSSPPLKTVALGGFVMEGTFLVPVVGKLLCLGVMFKGLGAVVSTLLAWRRLNREEGESARRDGAAADTQE
jgi:hypothetical protein